MTPAQMTPALADAYSLAPVLTACAFGILIILGDAFLPRGAKSLLARLGVIGGLSSLAAVTVASRHAGDAYSGLIRTDAFSLFFESLIFVITVLVMLGSYDYLEREGLPLGEYHALLLFAASGMAVMASAQELLTAFIGLEISSIASYVLAGYRRTASKSNESALKYFLLGSFATAFFLYGAAMVYGATGTTRLDVLREIALTGPQPGPLMLLGCGMMLVGLGFKAAVAPFQVWTPDVYEGAPTPVTALFASGPKAAAFALLVRILVTGFGPWNATWFWAIWVSAVLTMFIGNLAALTQDNVKRMLAYSSIAHAGYLLVALAARSEIGIAALLFYLVVYALVKLGAFTIITHLADAGERRLDIDSYAGLGTRQPVTAFCLTIFLLSLMGLPITAGFLGKFYIFDSALKAQLPGLAVMLAINSVIGAYYYLRLVRVMYFTEPDEEWTPEPVPAGVGTVMFVTAFAAIVFGLFPGALMTFAAISARSFR